ncbi:MAG: hypothetical protein ACTHOJ_17855 [Sphingomonas oligoaromativorans]|uniref:hypothetical protein n=1 Tax=Sphingomonas oligoaromativorans TaxID=575322 RepID=UPI0014218BB4|nr:hypothetical protein [Sphingomonas oligoaromativorans]NIJ32839.1 hypothetical protein [Sphingomonas oligoaromativorans]
MTALQPTIRRGNWTDLMASPVRIPAAEAFDTRRSLIFAHAGFIICMIFQRFGHMFGGSALFFSLPAFGLLLGWAVATGIATVRERGAALYMMFAGWTLIATLYALLAPDARFGTSLTSLLAILLTYGFTVLGPGSRFDRAVIFPVFLFYTRLCAVLGIIQWVIQFGGVRIFSFMLTVPPLRPVLIESQFNFNPTLHYGSSILRSNGFFLIEPSVFSQTLAIAIVLDYFILGRAKYLPLYLLAYLLSFSGTGALTLALAVPFYACLSAKNFGRVAGLLIAGALGLAVASVAFPEQVGSLTSRVNELNYSGSSGYARFIGPFLPISDLMQEGRILIGWGPGATERYLYHVEGTGNSIAKLVMDYGLIGIGAFIVMFLGTLWRRDYAILSVLAFTTFVVGGGYLLFTPILVLLMLLCIWSGLPEERIRSAER